MYERFEGRNLSLLSVLNNFEKGFYFSDDEETKIVCDILQHYQKNLELLYFTDSLNFKYYMVKGKSECYFARTLCDFLYNAIKKGCFNFGNEYCYTRIYKSVPYETTQNGQLTNYGVVCYKLIYICQAYLADFYSKFKGKKSLQMSKDYADYAEKAKIILDKQIKENQTDEKNI